MNKQRLLLSAAAAAFVAFGVAAPASAETLNVVASFTVLADVVKQVGGNHVKVSSLVGPNGDPHEFEPSPADAKTLNAAKVVFVSGEGLEGWMDRLITASGYKGTPVVTSEGVNTRTMVDDGKTVTDPHVWNSPVNVKVWVANIEKALSAADPADAADFKANAERYTKVLTELDAYAHGKFDKIPDDRRKVLTSHDAFGYFGREYKVNFLSPLGVSTETEASAADVAKLIEQIKTEHVKTYFFENSNDPRLVKQVAKATGAEPGGELYVESLSKANGPASTYEKMFRYNVDQLAAAMAKSS
ncbi:zinc/manganese transport system substrate-binding protein [Rhizobium sp. ERR 922]|uniref:metal ABC transporter solute-binding protein, Zn/Mn family n=1 Tax=Rhizobium TaxID=379 RepID=UPI000DDD9222|nr:MULTISPECIES: zinc ABC transporter substrate-binding protein [Rhizobium]MCZ3375371.1 zinc ABC transporter substrate-binding protein [Rhizobium sp. AG207R]TWB15811.1 zinc/manganese transport system substrate-binding protein [Rhizobium sp. ERR1071]TWB55458.1 zinc/manganese transport system substrate-binding protein [Rhizobium sp. ERR 922]TWB97208.1 zinc/manganese transport system substrate-binding protein [Rhizobium sp. ERR 942]GES44462.1 metal ABC transporter substrate-binding protein [Rhizo